MQNSSEVDDSDQLPVVEFVTHLQLQDHAVSMFLQDKLAECFSAAELSRMFIEGTLNGMRLILRNPHLREDNTFDHSEENMVKNLNRVLPEFGMSVSSLSEFEQLLEPYKTSTLGGRSVVPTADGFYVINTTEIKNEN